MRMDEYQKWLDAQFLEDEPAEAVAALATAVVVDTRPEVVEETMSESAQDHAPVLEMAAAHAPHQAKVELDTQAKIPDSLAVEERERIEPASGPVFRSQTAHTPHWAEDSDVPSIENYLPFLKREMPDADVDSNLSERTPISDPLEPAKDKDSVNPVNDVAEVSMDSPGLNELNMLGGEPVLPLEEIDLAPVQQDVSLPVPILAVASQEKSQTPSASFRGRRARNVNVASNIEPIQLDSLWSLVPKHIQVLVAMGTDDNVVQNSYRRSFKENRIELIEKILDPTLSLEDTARLLNVCPTTVRRYTNKGLLTHQRTTGDQRRFKLSDVLTFLEANSAAETRSSNRPART
jgi:excisionase family DNA binding protein